MYINSIGTLGGHPINAKDLEILLKGKADRRDADFLWKTKATKQETKSNTEAIELLRDQLDHAVILLIESVKNSIVWHSDSKNLIVNRNASVLHQLNSIYKWINSDYLWDSSVMDELDSISKFNTNTKQTILPVTANKLFGRRKGQESMRPKLKSSINHSARVCFC